MSFIRTFSLAVFACILLLSCGKKYSSTNDVNSNDPYKNRTLKIISTVIGGKTPEEQALFVKEMERKLGFKIKFFKPPTDVDNILRQVFSSGESYDLINYSTDRIPIFIDEEAVMPLDDIITKSKVLSDPQVVPPGEWEIIKYNGKIYGVPAKLEGGRLPIVREDWIKEFNIKDPVTIEDWENYWKLAKEKKSAYGISTQGLYDFQPWASGWGIKDGYVIKDGKREIPYSSDQAAPFWDWMAKMYKAGYIDPNFIVNKMKDARNGFFGDTVASLGYWDAWVGLFNNAEEKRYKEGKFIAKGINGVPGPDGKVILTRGASNIWFIPYNAENVDMAVKFLEYWNSPDGYMIGSVGVEGYDYTKDKDGKIVLTDIGKADGLDHGSPRSVSQKWTPPFGYLPGVLDAQKIVMANGTPMDTPTGWDDALKIIEYWAFKAIKGEISGKGAVIEMRKELKEKNLTD